MKCQWSSKNQTSLRSLVAHYKICLENKRSRELEVTVAATCFVLCLWLAIVLLHDFSSTDTTKAK